MKPFKTFSILFFFFFFGQAKAQFFPDSLVVTGVQYFPLISQGEGYAVRYYRDSVTFDSISGNDEFYTVERRTYFSDSIRKFRLRVNDKRVYFTGKVNYGQPFLVSDKMIYDYNYNVGESFVVKLNNDTLMDIKFTLDSTKMIMFDDGINRLTHYYTKRPYHNLFNDQPFYSVEGLGYNLGISYLKMDNFPEFGNEWISACVPDKLIYGNPDCYVGGYRINPSCEEDSIRLEVMRAQQAGIDRRDINTFFDIYPNPANGSLTINTILDGTYSIMDQAGKICMKDVPFSEGTFTIDITSLKTGIYVVYIQTEKSGAFKKISVINNR